MKVILASGQSFPDALAGSALLAPEDRILLTGRDVLPMPTIAALFELKPTRVIILGGTAVVSAAVEAQVAKDFPVSRIAGADRYDTASKIALWVPSQPEPEPEPEPEPPVYTVIDGGGAEQALILRAAGNREFRETHWKNYRPQQNGSHIIYENRDGTTLFKGCVFTQINGKGGNFANDHILYPGVDPGHIVVDDCLFDASGVNGAALHAYHHGKTPAQSITIVNTDIILGVDTYWAVCVFGAVGRVHLENVSIQGGGRRPGVTPFEISSSIPDSAITMINVTQDGRPLTKADLRRG